MTCRSSLLIPVNRSTVRRQLILLASLMTITTGAWSQPSPTCGLGDGGPATGASLAAPFSVAIDPAGALYIADNNRIRKVSNGIIDTVAGNGQAGYSGDGGPASAATISRALGVAVDAHGNVYVSDNANFRIRMIGVDGTITTLAGNGVQGFSGDGGPATSASLSSPQGVAVDAEGNVFVADPGTNRVRTISNGIITTVAGGGTDSPANGKLATQVLLGPTGVAVDAGGNVIIGNQTPPLVLKVSQAGIMTIVAGNGEAGYSGDGGPATSAMLGDVHGVAVDASGIIYIADSYGYRIRKVAADGIITTVAGIGQSGYSGDGGPAAAAQLSLPTGVALDGTGNLYIADSANFAVREVSSAGTITTSVGNLHPEGLAVAFVGPDAGQPVVGNSQVQINVSVADKCGNPVGASVVFDFDDGTPSAKAIPAAAIYYALWRPNNVAAKVKITATATTPFGTVGTAETLTVTLGPGISGIKDAASYTTGPFSPGSMIVIFGNDLAGSTAQAQAFPLPQTLGETTVYVGLQAIPLIYVSPGQINALLPYDIANSGTVDVFVQNRGVSTQPFTINLAPANPGVFTVDQSGLGQGTILNQDFSVNGPNNPAVRGSTVQIYCQGLGPVTNPVIAGDAAPPSPLSNTVNPVTVAVGGIDAQVPFAGLAPGFAGLYQVNATVPADAPTGNGTSLMISVLGQASAPVAVAVK